MAIKNSWIFWMKNNDSYTVLFKYGQSTCQFKIRRALKIFLCGGKVFMIKTLENAIFSADTKKHTKYKEYGMNGLWQFFEEAHKKMLKNTFDQLRKKTNVGSSWSQNHSPKCSSDKIKLSHQQVAENTGLRPIPFNPVNIASLLVRQNLLASSDNFTNKVCWKMTEGILVCNCTKDTVKIQIYSYFDGFTQIFFLFTLPAIFNCPAE